MPFQEAIYTALVLLFLWLTFICCKNCIARKSSIPVYWPVVGMIPELLSNVHRVHDFVTDFLEESGGTFLFKGPSFSNMDMLVTADPANVHYILTKNFQNFGKGTDFKKIFDVLGEGIFNAESESWENQRRVSKTLLANTNFQQFSARTTWSKVETRLIPILDTASETGVIFDLQDLCERLAFDITCLMVLGHDPGSLSKELPHLPHEKAFADMGDVFLHRHVFPQVVWRLQKWLQIGREKKMSKATEAVHLYISQCMIRNEEKIEQGKDTISAALAWFFYLLATNPQQEKRIREEISSMQPRRRGAWSFSSIEELKRLVYLHGALCETLRLFPPVALQHKAPIQDDILPSGHRLKANTKTILSFYSMGRMESIWGEDCMEFKPERWISKEGISKVVPSFKFPAFNAGPRSCIGKEMSFVQLKIVAAAVVSRFTIQVAEGHSVVPRNATVIHMEHGHNVKVSGLN